MINAGNSDIVAQPRKLFSQGSGANAIVKLQLRLPDNIHRTAKHFAREQEISLNQFLVTSISNELVRQETRAFFAPIAEEFDESAFREALARVPEVPPDEEDRLP